MDEHTTHTEPSTDRPTDRFEAPTAEPTTHPTAGPQRRPYAGPAGIRIADADREQAAERIRTAASEGRLTLEEADERQHAAYAARFAGDLTALTSDLPALPAVRERRELTPDQRRRLLIHAGIGAAFALLFVVRWVLGPIPMFWPAAPIFWIGVSIAAHYLITTRRRAVRA
ncbi:DUF1707 domain-containing protein [Pseudonocardia ailaonensis]|uniref:DUF1707 domain-containing protein n=1 Tax=Pseudonocardia ailaonensis TaxID=367279 RepID=A0ABN2MQW9_9PSEU